MGRLLQRAAAALPSSFCHQDGQILTDLHKGGKVGAVHHLMVQSMKVRKAWQPECETAGHMTSAVGKPRDVVLSFHAPARSVTGTLPWDGATHTQGALSSANPIQKPLADEHWKLSPAFTISVRHCTQVGQCSKRFWWGLMRPVDSNSRIQAAGHRG